MAIHDWDDDDEMDLEDDFIEYGIYNDFMDDDNDYKSTYRKPTYRKPIYNKPNNEVKPIGLGKLSLIILGIIAAVILIKEIGVVDVALRLSGFLCVLAIAVTVMALEKVVYFRRHDPDNEDLPIYHEAFKFFLKCTLISIGIFGLVILIILFIYR